MRTTIKVLIVDDSALIRQMLARALSVDPKIEIVGTAKDGVEAIQKAGELDPDVITLDIEMPELTGLEALPHLIKGTSARVVMLSSVDDPDTTYQALSLGAVDFIVKPKAGFATSLTELSDHLLKKIKTAYRIPPERRVAGAGDDSPTQLQRLLSEAPEQESVPTARAVELAKVVAIAASTGGPPALEVVFSGLRSNLPAAFLIVQHLPSGFTSSLARRLTKVTDIRVHEGREGAVLRPGEAYIAPHGVHMHISGRKLPRIRLKEGPLIHGVRPAADPLFESVAQEFGESSIGVVLTGMGSDGASGLKQMFETGGATIVQDEATSTVWGMPKAAARIGAASRIVPLGQVATEIRRAIREEA